MIVGQNSILNQYVPTFYIKDLKDGQTLVFDSVRRAFINAEGSGTGGAERLGDLLDVADSVDNPLSLADGQVLTYNSTTELWENRLIDINDLLPGQAGNAGKVLSTNGTSLVWVDQASGGSGTVTSINVEGASGRITSTGGPITTSGTISIDLATTGVTAGSYTNANVTVDSFGRITNISNGSSSGGGTVTSVSVTGNQGVTALVVDASTTPLITVGLGNITPLSVSATGTVTGSNLSGVNTGDQTITLTGDVTGSGTGTFPTTLATVNTTPGVYGDAHFVPTVTVNEKGLVTSITTQHVDTSVRDLILEEDVLVIAPRHQYIVTSVLEVEGLIINNGVIAIL